MTNLEEMLKKLLRDVILFVRHASGLKLRRYQEAAARAIVNSVLHHKGLSFVVIFPRQSGKNELQAQVQAYLLTLLSGERNEIVQISPTWKPQAENAMRRLEEVLSGNLIVTDHWHKHFGHIYQVGKARVVFLSGSPTANIVGATASALLSVDEAQDILIEKFDKEIAPMTASTNATTVFWGTAWTSRTLLARELRTAKALETRDGIRRVFHLNADRVIAEVPEYGAHLAAQVARLGRNHPMIRTQYYCEEIDAEGGLFSPERQSLMQGAHPYETGPRPGAIYAMLLDVAGADEGVQDLEAGVLANPSRDATALTIIAVEAGAGPDKAPVYRVVHRRLWVGVSHTRLFGQVRALAETWRVTRLVVDATGVGAGLTAFLDKALPGRVEPFVFSSKTKSELGWGFLAVIDSGRFRDYAVPEGNHGEQSRLWTKFYQEASFCQYSVLPGPAKTLRWGVPDGTRDPASGELVHDDLLISASLCATFDEVTWQTHLPAVIIPGHDPMKEIDRG
ncbi:MAG: hypothetical protein H0S79_10750 [Anaerolineaceae bacterium]|nr:hypothetical protein [Anaerolineaceae bacterium]